MSENTVRRDGLYHILLMNGQARAMLIDSTHLVERAREIHGLSRTATVALGRLLTQTVMMGRMLKGEEDIVTTIVKGSGPIGTMMAVANSKGKVKGYADNPEVEPDRAYGDLKVGTAVGREGRLVVIKDMGFGEPYTGQVDLVSGEIAEDFAMYYTASEQTPSLVSLGVTTGASVISAGGLFIQLLPGADEVTIKSLELSAGMFKNISDSIRIDGLDGSVGQLLTHLDPVIIDKWDVEYECDCSRMRMERALVSLGEKELQQMIDEGQDIELHCHFCNEDYHFTPGELEALLRRAKN